MLQEKFSHPGVNWFDGMSINKGHFVAQENHLKELYIDAVGQRIDESNYGILPSERGEPYSVQIEIDNRNVLQAKVRNLRAVTLGGARVEITASSCSVLKLTKNLSEPKRQNSGKNIFALVLTVNSFARIPFGDADPEETPPRKPYILPEYTLDLVHVKEFGVSEIGLFHLTLGVIRLENGQFSVESNYIPPCTSIISSPLLLDFYERTERTLIQLEKYVTIIVQKVRGKQQDNKLAQSISGISENILTYLSHELSGISLHLRNKAPIFLIEKVMVLSRITHNSIETWQGSGKEELLNYLTEWCDLNQGMLDKTLRELSVLKYNHYDTAVAVEKATDFLNIINPLFKTLSELDYIGKKIDTNLFVTEELAKSESGEKMPMLKSWFKK